MIQRYFLNGVEIKEPLNYAELEVELDFSKDGDANVVTTNEWELGVNDSLNPETDGVKISEKQIDGGLAGGVGVGEGIPFKIELDNQLGAMQNLFDGYLDLWEAEQECGLISAPATEQGRIDWLNDTADSISFEFLESIGVITSANYVAVPYCINKKINGVEIIISVVTVFVVTDKLADQIADIQQSISRLTSPFSYGEIIAIVFKMIYIAVLILTIVKLIIDLYNTIIQPVKYHYGMYEKDLMEIGCNYLGIKFSSSILQKTPFDKSLIIPEKFNVNDNNTGLLANVLGFFKPDPNEQVGFFKGTFGDLIRQLKDKYYAKLIMDGDTLFLEPQDFQLTSAQYTLPPVDDNDKRTRNKEDFVATRIISFSVDQQDYNTIQDYNGTKFEVITRPITINNPKMVLLKTLENNNLRFALAKRKTKLNAIEEILSFLFKVIGTSVGVLVSAINGIIEAINFLTNLLNGFGKLLNILGIKIEINIPTIPKIDQPNLKGFIEDRIGMMVLESDFIGVQRNILVGNSSNPRNNKLLPNNEAVQNAEYLYDNFHYHKSFVPDASKNFKGNQWEIRNFTDVPFCYDDYVKVKGNNKIFTSDGEEAEIISLKFNPAKETAKGSYRVRRIYTNNLTESKQLLNGK